MISRKLSEIEVSDSLMKRVSIFNVSGGWNKSDSSVTEFKKIAKELLYKNQDGKCAYCGLSLNTRSPEIDHIAPKGGEKRVKYPQFSFLPVNLVYSCRRCNSTQCKGSYDPVKCTNGSTDYYKWSFKIVHPYLDDPKDFFNITNELVVMPFIIPGIDADKNEKAKETIKVFKLDSEEVMSELGKEILSLKYPDEFEGTSIEEISTYRGNE